MDLPSALLLQPAHLLAPPTRPCAREAAPPGTRPAWPPEGDRLRGEAASGPADRTRHDPGALGRCSPPRPASRAGPWRAKEPLLGRRLRRLGGRWLARLLRSSGRRGALRGLASGPAEVDLDLQAAGRPELAAEISIIYLRF